MRRQRETGMKGLGQVLKSFRDRSVDFSVYDRASGTDAYLHSLGPLEIPQQGSRAGLHVDVQPDTDRLQVTRAATSRSKVTDLNITPIPGKSSRRVIQ